MKLSLTNEQMEEQKRHECPFCTALLRQNEQLHDRLLAVYAPTVAQTLPGMPSFQMDYRGPEAQPVAAGRPLPQELPGTQVGDGE